MGETQEYKQGDLTFTLGPRHTVVATPLQRFYLHPKATYWNRRLKMIKVLIALGEVRDLSELAGWCGSGIEWRASSLSTEILAYNEDKQL